MESILTSKKAYKMNFDSVLALNIDNKHIFLPQPPHSPPYTATVLFELYKTSDKFYIQLFYKNTTNENLSPLNIPSCGVKCSLADFRRIYASIIPTDTFEKECEVSLMSMTYTDVEFRGLDGSWIALILLFLILLVVVAISWKMFHQERYEQWYHRI